jgi:triosephosphate isomerase
VAAQNVYDKPNGAFTGELSVAQLKDSKIDWTLVGHSERRVILKEDDDVRENNFGDVMANGLLISCSTQFVARKVKAALDGGLKVILCIGESLEV